MKVSYVNLAKCYIAEYQKHIAYGRSFSEAISNLLKALNYL